MQVHAHHAPDGNGEHRFFLFGVPQAVCDNLAIMSDERPRYISIHITDRCNARCRHCHIWKIEPLPQLSLYDYFNLVDQLGEWLGKCDVIVAGGEPLLSDYTLPLIERCGQNRLFTVLATNGFLLDADMAAKLKSAHLGMANISLDGFDHTHDRIRRTPGGFSKVMSAIENLNQAGIPCSINCTIMEDNLDQITGLVDFLMRNHKIDGFFFQAIAKTLGERNLTESWYGDSPHFPKDPNKVAALLDELLAMKHSTFPFHNTDNQFAAMKAYFANPSRFSLATCTVGDRGFSISATGFIHFCADLPPVARITEGHIRNLLASKNARDLRKRMHRCRDNCHMLINCSFDPDQLIS